jgi:uncharacterized membrane protein
MDLLTIIAILVRRWYVFFPIVALTVIGLLLITPQLQPEYQASGSLLVVGPKKVTQLVQGKPTEIAVNPLLGSGQPLMTTSATLASDASSLAVREGIKGSGAVLDYTITVDSHAPIITVVDRATTASAAIQAVDILLARMSTRLATLQQEVGAPSSDLVDSKILNGPIDTTILSGSKNRTVILLAFAGLILATSAAFTVDGIITGRRRSTGSRRGELKVG